MKRYKRLAIDSMILIYLIERNKYFFEKAKKYLENASELTLSSFGIAEILTGFEKTKNLEGKLKFLSFIECHEHLSVPVFGKEEAFVFARLRAKYPFLKAPDAIHLAHAITARADAFLTNDKELKRIEEVTVLNLT